MVCNDCHEKLHGIKENRKITRDEREVFTEKLITGNRTYFFDVKRSVNGMHYITISELNSSDKERHGKIMIFEENMSGFYDSFKKAMQFVIGKESHHEQVMMKKKNRSQKQNEYDLSDLNKSQKEPSYSVEEIRQQYSNAYAKWSQQEDILLTQRFHEGKKVFELSEEFKRQPGSIRSRLRKLGLL